MPSRGRLLASSLLKIRTGATAVRLPSKITKLEIEFSQKNENGGMGARKFVRLHLSTLAYYNPGVKIEVFSRKEVLEKPELRIFENSATTPTKSIFLKNRHSDEITSEFLGVVDGEVLPEDPEVQELRILVDKGLEDWMIQKKKTAS